MAEAAGRKREDFNMRVRSIVLAAVAVAALTVAADAQDKKLKIGFLPGVVDPFY